jgi:hypothetical protein
MKTFIAAFGWYGMAAIILAYALVSFGVLQPTSLSFQLLNATGAIGIVIVSFHKKAYQPGALNLIWMVIALVAIAQILV